MLLFDRFALGPATASNLAGVCVSFLERGLFRDRLRPRTIPYRIAVGVGFLVSPVVQGLGVGLFGREFRLALCGHGADGAPGIRCGDGIADRQELEPNSAAPT